MGRSLCKYNRYKLCCRFTFIYLPLWFMFFSFFCFLRLPTNILLVQQTNSFVLLSFSISLSLYLRLCIFSVFFCFSSFSEHKAIFIVSFINWKYVIVWFDLYSLSSFSINLESKFIVCICIFFFIFIKWKPKLYCYLLQREKKKQYTEESLTNTRFF